MQPSQQRRRHDANLLWPESGEQFSKGAPALDLLLSGDVSTHAARIGFANEAGKPFHGLAGGIGWEDYPPSAGEVGSTA